MIILIKSVHVKNMNPHLYPSNSPKTRKEQESCTVIMTKNHQFDVAGAMKNQRVNNNYIISFKNKTPTCNDAHIIN